MFRKLLLNLQLFGEGGDGGDGGSTEASGEVLDSVSGEDIPAFIPEKARKHYQKALEKSKQPSKEASDTEQTTNVPKAEGHKSYADLIKSDEYKEEHKAYMDKTIGDRLKKYKGMESKLSQSNEILSIVANKYGISPDSEDFLSALKEKAEADDSYYEQYAMDHDVSTQEARRIVTMERKVAQIEAEKAEAAKQEENQRRVQQLMANAEQTKAKFPMFDLDTEWADERFRRLCFANNGDTTAAYMACHYNEIISNAVQFSTNQAKQQTVNAIASGKSRPLENGMSSAAPSVVTTNFKNMNLQQIRAYADEQRRKQRGL